MRRHPRHRRRRSRSGAPAPCASPPRPRSPTTMRTRSELRSRGGMKSMTRPRPRAVSKRSRESACRRDSGRVTCASASHGRDAASGRARALPSSAAKHAPESKRGQHSQSIEPSRADQRGGLAVADQRVVFDPHGHGRARRATKSPRRPARDRWLSAWPRTHDRRPQLTSRGASVAFSSR